MFEQTTDIYCPECGDPAEDMPPTDWRDPGEVPGYRHVSDRTALCPVLTRDGYCPAEPIEHDDLERTRWTRDGRDDDPPRVMTPEEPAAEVEALPTNSPPPSRG